MLPKGLRGRESGCSYNDGIAAEKEMGNKLGDVQVTTGAGTRRVDYQNSDPEWIYNELLYVDDTQED